MPIKEIKENKSKCCNAEIIEGLGYDGHKSKSPYFSEYNEHDDFINYWLIELRQWRGFNYMPTGNPE